jgi:limonene-1,2-epoxide hydrolase
MAEPSPREVVEAFVARFRARDVDALIDLYAPDASLTDVGVCLLLGGTNPTLQGRTEILQFFTRLAEMSPDRPPAVERRSLIADGPLVAIEYEDSGTRLCEVFEVERGLIRAQRTYWGSIPPNDVLEYLLELQDSDEA